MTYNVFSGTLNPTHFTSVFSPEFLMCLFRSRANIMNLIKQNLIMNYFDR